MHAEGEDDNAERQHGAHQAAHAVLLVPGQADGHVDVRREAPLVLVLQVGGQQPARVERHPEAKVQAHLVSVRVRVRVGVGVRVRNSGLWEGLG